MAGKRRTLTIKEENDIKIQHMRSKFLHYNIDIDYTTMVNILIDLGNESLGMVNVEIVDIFKKYIDRDDLYDILINLRCET